MWMIRSESGSSRVCQNCLLSPLSCFELLNLRTLIAVARAGVGGFAHEQVDVLGHDHVGMDFEAVLLACFFQDVFEGGFRVVVGQVGETAVTTEGDEVVVTPGLVAFETGGHG